MATTARRLLTPLCLSAILVVFHAAFSHAQSLDLGSAGRLFVVAFPDTVTNTFDSRYPNRMKESATLLVYTAVDNHVRVTSPTGYSYAASVGGGTMTTIALMGESNQPTQIFQPKPGPLSQTTFRVEADEPIIVYCHFMTRYGGEAFTPVPVESWGSEYHVATAPGQIIKDIQPGSQTDYRTYNAAAPAVASIVAAFDNTNVTIVPRPGLRLVGNPLLSTTLNNGECYSIRGVVDTATANEDIMQGDLTGTIIYASRPIGVVSGNPRTAFGHDRERTALAENSFKNAAYEWLAPTEQHGTYFVHLPIWDSRRITGQSGEKPDEKRMYERVLVIPTSADSTLLAIYDSGVVAPMRTIAKGMSDTSRWSFPRPHVYVSDHPAQAFHQPFPTLIHVGSIWGPGAPGDGWYDYGGFMQEIVPREQWTSFAPYYAMDSPPSMEHFVAIVTDTVSAQSVYSRDGARVTFNRGVIPGTDLTWGTATMRTGQLEWFEGRDGARFYAVQYGLWKGYEAYRHTATRGDGGDQSLVRPAEYEENTAVAYGLPLAPRRLSLVPSDSFEIEVMHLIDAPEQCNNVRIHIRALNAHAGGLRAIYIADSSTNARLVVTNPLSGRIAGQRDATMEVLQVDALRPAHGAVVVEDRSGRRTNIPFSIAPPLIRLTGSDTIGFGKTDSFSSTDAAVWFLNPNDRTMRIDSISMGSAGSAFVVVSPTSRPVDVAQHDSVKVTIRYRPIEQGRSYSDSLYLHAACTPMRTVLTGSSFRSCVTTSDLDFGMLRWPADSGATRTVMLRICNDGDGPIVLPDTLGTQLLVWSGSDFSVAANWFDSLSGRSISVGECYSIPVVFRVTRSGIFKTTAHVRSGFSCSRDSTVWTAIVAPAAGVESDVAGYRLVDVRPIPASTRLHIAFTLGRSGHLVVQLIDMNGREVSLLHSGQALAGTQNLSMDLGSVVDGTYILRISSGTWEVSRTVVVRR